MPASLRVLSQQQAEVEFRSDEGPHTIEGYAARFYRSTEGGTEYHLWGDVFERLRGEAFDRAMLEKHDVRVLYNHNADNLLARTANGTCKLTVDSKGLRYAFRIDPFDPDHQRVVAKINRGDLTGSSFAFRPVQVDWETLPDGRTIRWVSDLDLFDVGPVTYPAYASTTTGVRGEDQLDAIRAEYEIWKSVGWRRRKLQLLESQYLTPKADCVTRLRKLDRELARTF